MTANISASDRLASVRKNVKAQLAQANADLLEAAVEITRSIDQGSEHSLTHAIAARRNLLELRNALLRTDSVFNESDSVSYIIPNLICANSENKVDDKTLGFIMDLLG